MNFTLMGEMTANRALSLRYHFSRPIGMSVFFCCRGQPGSNCIPRAAVRDRGVMQPRKFTCRSALETRGPGEPLPGHGHRHLTHLAAGLRRMDCTLYNTRPKDFSPAPSIKRTSESNTRKLREAVPAGQHHPALWAFCTPTLDALSSPPLADRQGRASSPQNRPPATAMDTHSRSYPG